MTETNQRIADALARSKLSRLVFAERLKFNYNTMLNWFRGKPGERHNIAPEHAALWAEANFPAGQNCPVCHSLLAKKDEQ